MTWNDIGRRIAVTAASAAVLALALALAAGAAPEATKNLIVNGNAELGEGVDDVNGVAADIPGWTRRGSFTVVKYSAPGGFPDAAVQARVKGGNNFFAGGPANPGSAVSQDVDVSAQSRLIDRGKLKATLSGYIGGYASQNDSLIVTATFRSRGGAKLGSSIRIGPVTALARQSSTSMLLEKVTVPVPKKTRSIRIVLAANRNDGSYNDGYADNLSLRLGG
jgi:hypothetical protein